MNARSKFVTVLAWIGILVAGLGAAASLVESLGLIQLTPGVSAEAGSETQTDTSGAVVGFDRDEPRASGLLGVLQSVSENLVTALLFPAVAFIASSPVVALVVFLLLTGMSVALLRRQKWARYAMLLLLALGLGVTFYGVYLQVQDMVLSSEVHRGIRPEAASVGTRLLLNAILRLVQAAAIIVALVLVLGKLVSQGVKDEFAGRSRAKEAA